MLNIYSVDSSEYCFFHVSQQFTTSVDLLGVFDIEPMLHPFEDVMTFAQVMCSRASTRSHK